MSRSLSLTDKSVEEYRRVLASSGIVMAPVRPMPVAPQPLPQNAPQPR